MMKIDSRAVSALAVSALAGAGVAVLVAATLGAQAPPAAAAAPVTAEEAGMQIHYLEIVTPDVDAHCAALARLHGVTFSAPVPELGNARTAALEGGGEIGVRAPMREDEEPVVRPYLTVDDIEAAVEAAAAAGGEIALPPTAIPARGRIAIYLQGGIQHGLWQP